MSEQERRRFQRVNFNVTVELAQAGMHWRGELLDISLKGMLLQDKLPEDFDAAAPLQAKVTLSDNSTITMHSAVAHQSGNDLGLACLSIDVDSICHLRRLIELNLGDAEAAERELAELML